MVGGREMRIRIYMEMIRMTITISIMEISDPSGGGYYV